MPNSNKSAVRQDSHPLPAELARPPRDSLRMHGPVRARQCDHVGVPIQEYVTILVECSGGNWLLRRLVSNVGSAGAGQLVEMTITPADAARWLTDHNLVSEKQS